MQTKAAYNGNVEIAYETFGEPGSRPLVLIGGLDGQMIWWHDGFCQALADTGFHVVRYDHRDAGLSTHFTGKKKAYHCTDMLDDLMAVMDALGWESAHLFGLSMGGGLAQFAALHHPNRVRTLTLVNALPMGGWPIGAFRYLRFPGPFKGVFRRYGKSRQEQVRMLADIMRLTEGPHHQFDDDWLTKTAERCMDRRWPDPHARNRQLSAALGEKLALDAISTIRSPTLIFQGDADPLIKPTAARNLLARIPTSCLVTVPGMGHTFTPHHWPTLLRELTAHTATE